MLLALLVGACALILLSMLAVFLASLPGPEDELAAHLIDLAEYTCARRIADGPPRCDPALGGVDDPALLFEPGAGEPAAPVSKDGRRGRLYLVKG